MAGGSAGLFTTTLKGHSHSARYRAVPRGNVLIETVYFNVGTHTASGTARYRAVNTVLIESGSIRAANLPL